MARIVWDGNLEGVHGIPTAYDVDDGYNLILGDGYIGTGYTNKIVIGASPIQIPLESGQMYRFWSSVNCLCEFIFVGTNRGSNPVTDDTGWVLVANVTEHFRIQQHRNILSVKTDCGHGILRIHKQGLQFGHNRT